MKGYALILVPALILVVLPPVAFASMIISYPGMVDTPVKTPDAIWGVPFPLVLIGLIIGWFLAPFPLLIATRHRWEAFLGAVTACLHYTGGIIALFIGVTLTNPNTARWQIFVESFAVSPASLVSPIWVIVICPVSLVVVIRKRRRLEKERLEKEKAEILAMIEKATKKQRRPIDEGL